MTQTSNGHKRTTSAIRGPGTAPANIFNRDAVAAVHLLITDSSGRNAVGVVFVFNRLPKVGAGAPTLGYGAQSRWDWFLQRLLSGLAGRFAWGHLGGPRLRRSIAGVGEWVNG